MANIRHDVGIASLIGSYSDAVEIPAGARILITSGTAPLAPDGSLAADIEGQAKQVWENVFAALEKAGMAPADLVQTTSYLTKAADIDAYVKIRVGYVSGIKPASMLLVCDAMIRSNFLVEVVAIAAKS